MTYTDGVRITVDPAGVHFAFTGRVTRDGVGLHTTDEFAFASTARAEALVWARRRWPTYRVLDERGCEYAHPTRTRAAADAIVSRAPASRRLTVVDDLR
jgi:hypothetical protein